METPYEVIYKKIWDLSPNFHIPDSYHNLNLLTQELIHIYDSQGRIGQDPFASTRERELSQPFHKINALLKGSVCLVTGGLGCVGSNLVNELVKFDVARIIVLDKNDNTPYHIESDHSVTVVHGDIRDAETVHDTFTAYKPDFVFHTAAQRDPGYAESHIAETVTTNVIGTLNIVKACEYTGSVRQCVFSSTGKASRYFTEEVYAGTKKMCEYVLDLYAREGRVKYSMVRFTHMLDNSLMNEELKRASECDKYVRVHSPGKYVTAQNKKEAASLLLNALLYASPDQCNFLLVKNLEWPVESLEVALYYIKKSCRNIPVVFIGNPLGYTEKFFRGQMDWSDPSELNLLINVYENKSRTVNSEGDIVISHICPSSKVVIEKALCRIERASGEKESKEMLVQGLKEMVRDALTKVNKKDTVDILNWGLQQKYLDIEKAKVSDYGAIIPMLFESLEGTVYYNQVEKLKGS
ncbi:polysaccharide biosynthesis protein [Chryseolinea sp. H1M3-3]|uniref:NAD-dependent epimerase/dehydratase family protein n=1 Tax=Chryseolinea sp. H1M3-3 TaxID=3034144 RepID=UPI0023EE0AAC|nr:polysaccharide biosynthesis protein [Chryseolinea sp. H1M3-3]